MDVVSPEGIRTEIGSIRIDPEVIAIIAGLAAVEIEGVAGMSGGLAGGIAEWLGRKNLSKGVKVQVAGHEVSVEVSIIVEFGHRIPEVAGRIQQNVRHAIESMTGLRVAEVNVHVHDVHFRQADRAEESESGHRLK
ncbi:MAG: alkaline-shock protein [Candidatus Reconcilbacillus cellulovorans]|uniref:Alkaline-shock protein n=1 Tax=Candidatus Reconcilbacillus cellulovorans TaxID=1906605 RepID=A0A2A6E153_9BACL|nr:MAG: alkaline-shock protein [Candidatus Reconcilbacillus cellulovorans]